MMNSAERIELIRTRLTEAFTPITLEIIDDSHQHIGHASARGGGHFTVRINSSAFSGKKPVERHRMVFSLLTDALKDEIHALSIQAKSPEEV